MKKWIAILLALVLALSLVACGESAADNAGNGGSSEGSGNKPAEPGYVFKHGTTEIVMNAPAKDIIAALGEPQSYSEQASCAFTGLDKTYNYGSFVLYTYPLDGVDYVYSLFLQDDGVATPEGITIGSSRADVEAAYGTAGFNGSNAYIMTKGASKLTIMVENDVVTTVLYDAIVE